MNIQKYILVLLLAFLSCEKELTIDSSSKKDNKIPISFCIINVLDQSIMSKSLIDDTDRLQRACTPIAQDGEGQSIGIWADRTEGSSTKFNVLGNDARLVYDVTKVGGNPHNPWNYPGDIPKYWQDPDNGHYKFRAYYPKSIEIHEISNATHFVTEYNTFLSQKDLLVAYNEVDASNPNINLRAAIPLRFKHALSALRFQMKFQENYSESDALTSFWLENKDTQEEGMSYIGMMVYGTYNAATNEGDKEEIVWSESTSKLEMYRWENSVGAQFENKGESTIIATAYTDAANTTTGKEFTGNDGWLLIIPQKSEGTVTMNFTTKKGGDAVYSIPIPAITGTNLSGRDPMGEYYLPGYRYTYTFTLTKTNADVTLSITPWNELDSSFEIPFNE